MLFFVLLPYFYGNELNLGTNAVPSLSTMMFQKINGLLRSTWQLVYPLVSLLRCHPSVRHGVPRRSLRSMRRQALPLRVWVMVGPQVSVLHSGVTASKFPLALGCPLPHPSAPWIRLLSLVVLSVMVGFPDRHFLRFQG